MPKPEPAPIACTLDLEAMGPRVAKISHLTRQYLRSHRLDGRVLRLTYVPLAAEQVARIVELERACCAFLDFELMASVNKVELAITAPEQESTNAQWLFEQFLPQAGPRAASAGKGSECECCGG